MLSVRAAFRGACNDTFSRSIAATPLPWVLWILRVLNIGNAVLLGISAFESAFIIDGSITRVFLMVYQGVFGLLLLLFELRIGPVARWIKKQFGFMFTFSGRLVFLVFVGAVTFGMIHDRPTNIEDASSWQYSMDWIIGVGIATLVNALVNAAVICSHPAFRQDPQGRMTEEEAIKYLKEHPEALARVPGPGTAGGTASPASVSAPAPGRASPAPRADFGASSGGYTPPVAPAQAPAPNSTAATAKGDSGFFGSADGGVDAGDIDPFSAAPAPSPTTGGGEAADDGNHFDDDDDDDNPFA